MGIAATLTSIINNTLAIWLDDQEAFHSLPAPNSKPIIHSLHSLQGTAKTFLDLFIGNGEDFRGAKRGPATDQPLHVCLT